MAADRLRSKSGPLSDGSQRTKSCHLRRQHWLVAIYTCLGISPHEILGLPSLYLALAAFHNDKLLLRRCPGKDNFCMMSQDVIQLLTTHVLQICAMNNASFGIPAIKRQYVVLLHKLNQVSH